MKSKSRFTNSVVSNAFLTSPGERMKGRRIREDGVKDVITIGRHSYRHYYSFNGWDKKEMVERAVRIKRDVFAKEGRQAIYRILSRNAGGEYVCHMYERIVSDKRMRPDERRTLGINTSFPRRPSYSSATRKRGNELTQERLKKRRK
jgi:hypothetical protein